MKRHQEIFASTGVEQAPALHFSGLHTQRRVHDPVGDIIYRRVGRAAACRRTQVGTPEAVGLLEIRGKLRGVGVDVGYLAVGHRAQDLQDHRDVLGSLHFGHGVERARAALDDEHARHATQKLKRRGSMLVGVIPEGSRRMRTGDLDRDRVVRTARLHFAQDVVRVALR